MNRLNSINASSVLLAATSFLIAGIFTQIIHAEAFEKALIEKMGTNVMNHPQSR